MLEVNGSQDGLVAVRRSSSLKVGLRALVPVRAGRDSHGGGRSLGLSRRVRRCPVQLRTAVAELNGSSWVGKSGAPAEVLGVDDSARSKRTTSLDAAMSPCRDQPSSDPIHGLCGTRVRQFGEKGNEAGSVRVGVLSAREPDPHLSLFRIRPNAADRSCRNL